MLKVKIFYEKIYDVYVVVVVLGEMLILYIDCYLVYEVIFL